MTTKAQTKTPTKQPEPNPIRDLAVAAAQNIATTDQVAVLVVIQKNGQARVTPVQAAVTEAIQALALGSVLLARALQAKPVLAGAVSPPIDQPAA